MQAKNYLASKGHGIVKENFDYAQLSFNQSGVKYTDVQYKKIVCCEGIGILDNPYFKQLPMVPAKGECLLVEIPSIDTKDIYKHKTFLVPLNKHNLFWVGSNYDWDFESAAPSPEGYEWLLQKLTSSIKVPFNVKQHIAAIRPTGKDRRPYLGPHPLHKNIFIFNALGTKGSSLALSLIHI